MNPFHKWGQSSSTKIDTDEKVTKNLALGKSGEPGNPWSFSEPWRNTGWLNNDARGPFSETNSFSYARNNNGKLALKR